MFEFSQSKQEILIKRNTVFLRIGIGAIVMCVWGIVFSHMITFADLFPIIFFCVWMLIVLSIAIVSFTLYSKQATINNDGIICKSFLDKNFIKWSDVKDWGLSYCGKMGGNHNIYYLFFSEHECDTKDECKKKLKGKMIKVYVIGDDYDEALSIIVPFCREKKSVSPFVAKDKFHFL